MRSHDSFVTQVPNTPCRPLKARIRQPPSMAYYDYSENFGEHTDDPNTDLPSSRSGSDDQIGHSKSSKERRGSQQRGGKSSLQRAQTSMIVNLDQTSSPDHKDSSLQGKGKLAEWEQLGINTKTTDNKQLSGPLSNASSLTLPSQYFLAEDRLNTPVRLPLALMDGAEFKDEVQSQEHDQIDEKVKNKPKAIQESKDITDATIVKDELSLIIGQENDNTLWPMYGQNELGSMGFNKDIPPYDKGQGASVKLTESVAFPTSQDVKIAKQADVPIHSPKPERPASYRDSDRRLSRILSIDEHFSTENDANPKPTGKRSMDQRTQRSSIRVDSDENATTIPIEKSSLEVAKSTIGSDGGSFRAASPFQRLRNHFKKLPMLADKAKSSISQQNAKSDTEKPPMGYTAEIVSMAGSVKTNIRSNRSKKQKEGGIVRNVQEASDAKSQTLQENIDIKSEPVVFPDGAIAGREGTGEEADSQAVKDIAPLLHKKSMRSLKTQPRSEYTLSTKPTISGAALSTFSFTPRHRTRAIKPENASEKSSVPDLAPKINLLPPTPSLGLDDVGSLFTNQNRSSSRLSAAGIPDAEPSTPDLAMATKARQSRRWTKAISSVLTSTDMTDDTEGMSWWQYMGWKVGDKLKKCWPMKNPCLGRRKPERVSSSFEMY